MKGWISRLRPVQAKTRPCVLRGDAEGVPPPAAGGGLPPGRALTVIRGTESPRLCATGSAGVPAAGRAKVRAGRHLSTVAAPTARLGGGAAILALLAGLALRPEAAQAASWSEAEPLVRNLQPDGTLPLVAGRALLIEPGAAQIAITTADGDAVPVKVEGAEVLIPSTESLRRLTFDGDLRGVAVRFQERRGDAGQWEAYERRVLRLLRTPDLGQIGQVETTPWGSARLSASIRLRARAVVDAGIARLGALADLEADRPASYPSHGAAVIVLDRLAQAGAPAGSHGAFSVVGPGLVRVRVQPVANGNFVRFPTTVSIDGNVVLARVEGSTGTVPYSEDLWLPPGSHDVTVDTAGTPATFGAEVHRLRGWTLAGRVGATGRETGMALAEAQFLAGKREDAVALFRSHLKDEGVAGAFARARVILLTDDLDELRRLATEAMSETVGSAWQPVSHDQDVVEVTADAILRRGAALDPTLVRAAVDAAMDPDPEALAAWLDSLGGSRPRGLAWQMRGADVPLGEDPRKGALREAARSTRWVRMTASSGMDGGFVSSDQWPGVPRAHVIAGAQFDVQLPDVGHGRVPVLALNSVGPARYQIDGVEHQTQGGDLTVALPAGDHTLAVESGEIVVPEASLVPLAPRTYDWQRTMLPATFPLPDAGAPVALRVDAAGLRVVHAVLRTATGTERPVDLDVSDGAAVFSANADETSVSFAGVVGGEVGLAMRTVRVDPPPRTVFDGDPGPLLAEIARLSTEIDHTTGGAAAASRIDRARLLATLGQVTACRQDLARALAADPSLREPAGVVAALLPDVPSAVLPGPQTTAATMAAANPGLSFSFGGTPADRATQLEVLGDSVNGAWLAAARERQTAGDLVKALDDARLAGPEGVELATQLELRVRYKSIPRVDTSAGLVPVSVKPDPVDPNAPLWHRVRDALLAAPADFQDATKTVTLRGPGGDLATAKGSTYTVRLYCRQEGAIGPDGVADSSSPPCVVAIRFDDEHRLVQIADGSAAQVDFKGPRGLHDVEISGPGDGYAVLARVDVDGKPLAMHVTRNAIRVMPGQPIAVSVAGEGVVRVDAVSGSLKVRLGDGAGAVHGVATAGAPFVAAAPGEGALVLHVVGDGEVFIYRGTFPSVTALAGAPDIPRGFPSPSFPVDSLLARQPLPPSDVLGEPGSRGSVRVGAAVVVDSLRAASVPYAALTGEWLRTEGHGWLRAGAWTHVPLNSVSVGGDAAYIWTNGFLQGHGDLVAEPGSVGLDGFLRVREGVPFAANWQVRGRAELFARPSFSKPRLGGDPNVWTLYRADHPFGASLDASVLSTPTRDLRWEGGLSLITNAGPTIDQIGPYLSVDLLPGPATWLGFDLRTPLKLADDHRAATVFAPRVEALVNEAIWMQDTRRLVLYSKIGLETDTVSPDFQAGLTWMWTDHRGLRDLAPDGEPFMTTREAL